jgi:hypothetical protein
VEEEQRRDWSMGTGTGFRISNGRGQDLRQGQTGKNDDDKNESEGKHERKFT